MARVVTQLGNALEHGVAKGSKILFAIAVTATGIMAVPTFLDVVCRYFFSFSIEGVIEIEEILLAFLTFGALAYIHDHRNHIMVDMFVSKCSSSNQRLLNLFNATIGVVVFGIMSYCLLLNAMGKYDKSEVTMALGIPVTPFVIFAAIGCFWFALSYFADWLSTLGSNIDNKRYIAIVVVLTLAALLCYSPWLIKGSALGQELIANKLLLGGLAMLLMLTLLVLGMPIGVGMSVIGTLGMIILFPNIKPIIAMLGIGPYKTASTYLFTVAPMFILMGELALYAGISSDLFKAANTWLGRLPGGLAVATISGCAGFSAVCGDSMATAVTMSSVALPELRKKNYDPGLACATLAAGGTLGILIPPSTGFIFYSLVTEVSIGKLFIAGVLPGLLLTAIFIGCVLYTAKRHPDWAPAGDATTFKEKLVSTKGIIAMLLLIILIMGGILSGIFTPNEGGAIGAVGTFIYAICRRRLPWKNFLAALRSATEVTAKLILILIGVGILGYFFAGTKLPIRLAEMISGFAVNRYIIFGFIVIFYIVMGCIMNVIPMILLTLPALFPTIEALQFDPVWFGVVTVILMEMGQITPPVGINVFAISSAASDVPMGAIFKRIVPFFLSMLAAIIILVIFPELATWLPSVLIG